jgi:hypothetical protein
LGLAALIAAAFTTSIVPATAKDGIAKKAAKGELKIRVSPVRFWPSAPVSEFAS